MKKILISIITFAIYSATTAEAQTGGAFEITKSVIASGGEQQSTGGSFSLDGTTGQSAAGGDLQNLLFSAYIGFWSPDTFVVTAANVSIGGRVLTANGAGISSASVTLTKLNGEIRQVLTGSFGYFNFSEAAAGETYILTVKSRQFVFAAPSKIIYAAEDLTDLNFTAEPNN